MATDQTQSTAGQTSEGGGPSAGDLFTSGLSRISLIRRVMAPLMSAAPWLVGKIIGQRVCTYSWRDNEFTLYGDYDEREAGRMEVMLWMVPTMGLLAALIWLPREATGLAWLSFALVLGLGSVLSMHVGMGATLELADDESTESQSGGGFASVSAIAASPAAFLTKALINSKATETTITYSIPDHRLDIVGDDSDDYQNGLRVATLQEMAKTWAVIISMGTAAILPNSFPVVAAALFPLMLCIYGASTVNVTINGEEVGDDG